MATRRAKVIEEGDYQKVLNYIDGYSDNKIRDSLIFLLSVKAGLRAVEIALLRWECVLNSDGTVADFIELFSDMTKKKKERTVPMNKELKQFIELHKPANPNYKDTIIKFGWKKKKGAAHAMVVWLGRLYESVGLKGCTSHSGRRTFITKAARVANNHGCSLVDIQLIVGHSRLDTTQGYIEPSRHIRSLVDAI